jgi:hypothetical protein
MDILLIALINICAFSSGFFCRSSEVRELKAILELQDHTIKLLKRSLEIEYEKQNKINLQK